MAFSAPQRNSPNSEIEVDGALKRTTYATRPLWLDDGGQWVGKKRTDTTDQDARIDLPGGHWIESKRTQARYLIGKGLDTRFNMDVKMETAGGGNNNYSLTSEGRTITRETVDEIDIEWAYSHTEGATTYPSVFKTLLKNSDFSFQFTAPTDDTYKLFLQITPVINNIASSQLITNKQGQVYGAEWLLDTGERLLFTFPAMAGFINEVDTELLGNTLFLYSTDQVLLTDEGFTLG